MSSIPTWADTVLRAAENGPLLAQESRPQPVSPAFARLMTADTPLPPAGPTSTSSAVNGRR
jgi:hypothetical protein